MKTESIVLGVGMLGLGYFIWKASQNKSQSTQKQSDDQFALPTFGTPYPYYPYPYPYNYHGRDRKTCSTAATATAATASSKRGFFGAAGQKLF